MGLSRTAFKSAAVDTFKEPKESVFKEVKGSRAAMSHQTENIKNEIKSF